MATMQDYGNEDLRLSDLNSLIIAKLNLLEYKWYECLTALSENMDSTSAYLIFSVILIFF